MLPEDVTRGDHCRTGNKQAQRYRQWIDVIPNKRSERISRHNDEKRRNKDRYFGHPFHVRLSSRKRLGI